MGGRVLLLNNYPMDEAARLVREGTYPGQHLWGCTQLPPEWSWELPPRAMLMRRQDSAVARKLKGLLWATVGDPVQCAWAWRERTGGAVVYAADQQSAAALGLLRRLGRGAPVVVMVHNGPRRAWGWRWLRRVDALLVLSPAMADRVRDRLPDGPPVHVLPWGPDLESPVYQVTRPAAPDLDFVAAGKTNRDYTVLRRVARDNALSGIIFGRGEIEHFELGVVRLAPGSARYPEVMAAMARARFVVIPLRDSARLSGLTELADALALDVPVIVTRTDLMPYDVERTGAGRWVDPGDDAGLLRALTDPLPADAGAGRERLRASYNMAAFGAELGRVFAPAVGLKA